VANGAGISAAGFLKGCLQMEDSTADRPSWSGLHRCDKAVATDQKTENGAVSCLDHCEKAWASDKDMVLAELSREDIMSSSKLSEIKDIVAPSFPASGKERPSGLRFKRKTQSLLSCHAKEEHDRCSCCTKEEFWILYDVFASMDRRGDGSVSRSDFLWALSAHGACIDFQKIIRRSQLSAYFKSTARDISLEEFAHRIFPNATAIDVLKMQRWMSWRKAKKMVTSDVFRGTREQLKQVFSFLEEDSCGTISASDLWRSQILSRDEVLAMAPSAGDWNLSYESFLAVVARVLVDKYTDFFLEENGLLEDWWDSEIRPDLETELKDKFGAVIDPLRFAFASGSDEDPLPAAAPVEEKPELFVADPLPPGVVTSLISRLRPPSPESQHRSHMGASPMCGVEITPSVPAC
jgi:Ca2+-binding EF-hand superfamily protein